MALKNIGIYAEIKLLFLHYHILTYLGPHGEIGASLRYLSQRYAMPYPELSAILTDIGTEELAHLEMVGTIVYQLTRCLTPEQIEEAGFSDYFVDHTTGVYPQAASGVPFSAATFAVTGDPIADLNEDLAAEQKARLSYDNILRFADDPDVAEPIKFLREREVVHYQRFGEANHTDLSRFYPLWAAHRGYLSPFLFGYSAADLSLFIAHPDIIPRLVIKITIVVGDRSIYP
ncbi:manganese catalase family protein [Acutalibacter sp. 1XD8-36]|nr:manganese catalase family protein [Acutalibacter sp. 1XD8-36]